MGSSLNQIQAASINYRIAIGPHAGRKALTLYSVPPLEEAPSIPLLATMYGFSLHAGTVCEAHQRSKLERLCRYITRPPIATKRLSVDDHGRVVYRYKRPFREKFWGQSFGVRVKGQNKSNTIRESQLHKIPFLLRIIGRLPPSWGLPINSAFGAGVG